MSSTQEQNLIERCRNGDSSAFGLLIQPYRRQLFSYLFRLSGDRIQCEDLFQETLIKTWRGIKKYSERQKFSSWLFTIAHNTAIDNLRSRRKDEFISPADTEELKSGSDPHSDLVNSETKKMIETAMGKLSEKQKEVLLLRLYGDLSFKEISGLTGEPINTVLSHMHYAVKKLKKFIGKRDV
ncbi:MAG: sigma-70 family RNA polymerase sigma factor [Melioribacteraceae bacterium]